MQDIAVISPLFKDQHRAFSIVHETGAVIEPMTEIIQQVAQVAGKVPHNTCNRDIVPTMRDPLGHTQFRPRGAGEPQIDQLHPPTIAAQTFDQAQIAAPGQRDFKGESLTLLPPLLDLTQKNPACSQQLAFWGERGETVREQVSVYDVGTTRHLRQILQRKDGLIRTIGAMI